MTAAISSRSNQRSFAISQVMDKHRRLSPSPASEVELWNGSIRRDFAQECDCDSDGFVDVAVFFSRGELGRHLSSPRNATTYTRVF